MTPVAVIIVTYREREVTAACARSVLASSGAAVAPLVVDNASRDGSAEWLRAALPGVEVVESPRNGGYTGGNNIGLRAAAARGAEFALVLNNDTVVAPDCVAQLLAEAARWPDAAFVSPRVFYADPPDLLWFGGSRYSPWTGRAVHLGRKRTAAAGLRAACDIPFASGCAVLVRLSALDRIGPLDEALFGYAEDLDWSLRASRAGYRIRYAPDAVLWHLEGAGYARSGGQALRQYLSARNLLLMHLRHARWYHWPSLAVVYAVDHLARFTVLGALHRDWAAVRATWRGALHAFTGGRHPVETAP